MLHKNNILQALNFFLCNFFISNTSTSFIAIEGKKKGYELRFEGKKFPGRLEASLMLLMGILEGTWPFEAVKLSDAETGKHSKLAFPRALIPLVPH